MRKRDERESHIKEIIIIVLLIGFLGLGVYYIGNKYDKIEEKTKQYADENRYIMINEDKAVIYQEGEYEGNLEKENNRETFKDVNEIRIINKTKSKQNGIEIEGYGEVVLKRENDKFNVESTKTYVDTEYVNKMVEKYEEALKAGDELINYQNDLISR